MGGNPPTLQQLTERHLPHAALFVYLTVLLPAQYENLPEATDRVVIEQFVVFLLNPHIYHMCHIDLKVK